MPRTVLSGEKEFPAVRERVRGRSDPKPQIAPELFPRAESPWRLGRSVVGGSGRGGSRRGRGDGKAGPGGAETGETAPRSEPDTCRKMSRGVPPRLVRGSPDGHP